MIEIGVRELKVMGDLEWHIVWAIATEFNYWTVNGQVLFTDYWTKAIMTWLFYCSSAHCWGKNHETTQQKNAKIPETFTSLQS